MRDAECAIRHCLEPDNEANGKTFSLPSGRYSLLGPGLHRQDRTSFAWRTHLITSSVGPAARFLTPDNELRRPLTAFVRNQVPVIRCVFGHGGCVPIGNVVRLATGCESAMLFPMWDFADLPPQFAKRCRAGPFAPRFACDFKSFFLDSAVVRRHPRRL